MEIWVVCPLRCLFSKDVILCVKHSDCFENVYSNSFMLNITFLIVWLINGYIERMFHWFKIKFDWLLAQINGHKTNYKLVLTLMWRKNRMTFPAHLKRQPKTAHPQRQNKYYISQPCFWLF